MANVLQNVRIGVKLPVVTGILVAVTIGAMSVANAFFTSNIITENAVEKLESMALSKRTRVETLLSTIDRDLRLTAEAPATSIALIALADGYNSLENPEDVLKRVYIDENEHPLGEKDKLIKADTGSSYGFIHAIYHPSLGAHQDAMGYYDLFLFDTEGNLVYSVFKENDFATNVVNGPWADSGLGEAYRLASQSELTSEAVFVDFAPYAPSADAPAAFIARPVFNDQGERLGVLAFQMPVQHLSRAASDTEGLGATAEGFIVGADRLMRTDSRQTEVNDILATSVEHEGIADAANGNGGMFKAAGHVGQDVIGYAVPLTFLGTDWVAVVQQDTKEVFAGLWSALFRALLLAMAVLGGVLVASIYFSRSISHPLRKLTTAVTEVAEGQTDSEVPCTERGDEIGELARKTEIFRQNSLRMERMSAEQKEASERLNEMNAEREKAAQREIQLAQEKEQSDRNAKEQREKMMRELGSSFGDVVKAALVGNFGNRIDASFDDEILNDLSQNINNLMETVDTGLANTGEVLARVAGGDLTQKMEGEFHGSFQELQTNVNNMIEALTGLVIGISESGNTLSSSSSELRQTADVLSRQTEQNAASVEETSAALEQLTVSLSQVNENILDVSRNAKDAKKTAGLSEQVARDAASSMDRIADGSKEINRVTDVINDIAFQINLLALNAGVEAARAGDAGRGFSVVASEVRQLAQRAGEAAKEIAIVLSQSDAAVTEGVSNVANAKGSLEEISKTVVKISQRVDDVTNAISEQSSGLKEIASAIAQVDGNTQKQAAAFEEVTASSHVLANEANDLLISTSKFHVSGKTPQKNQIQTSSVPTVPKQRSAKPSMAVGAENYDQWKEF